MATQQRRRQVEDTLRRNEERYRLATRATRDVIWDWDMMSPSASRPKQRCSVVPRSSKPWRPLQIRWQIPSLSR
jgi:PAS domain-containing protein